MSTVSFRFSHTKVKAATPRINRQHGLDSIPGDKPTGNASIWTSDSFESDVKIPICHLIRSLTCLFVPHLST